MLESNCNLIDLKLGQQEIGVLNRLNCSVVFGQFPRLDGFYNYFKNRPNIREYIIDAGRAKFKVPYDIN